MIFESDFESGTLLVTDNPPGDWDSLTVSGGGGIEPKNAAALHGLWGARVIYPTAEGGQAYLAKSLPQMSEVFLRMVLRVTPQWSMEDLANELIATLDKGAGSAVVIKIKKNGLFFYLSGYCATDMGVSPTLTTFLGREGIYTVQIHWRASSGDGADDGLLEFYIEDEQRCNATGLDNDTFYIEGLTIGTKYKSFQSTSGELYFDDVAVGEEFIPAIKHMVMKDWR